MLVLADDNRIALLARDVNGHDLACQIARCNGCGSLFLAGLCHAILRCAFDAEFNGDVFSGFWHGVHAILSFHLRIDKAPANGGVIDGIAARKGRVGLGHDKGRTAHALHAACNHEPCLARLDGASGNANSIQT